MKQKQKTHFHKFTSRLIEFSDRQVNRAMFVMLLIATTAVVINIPNIMQYFTAQPSSALGVINPKFTPSMGTPIPYSGDFDNEPWEPEGDEILIAQNAQEPDIHNDRIVYQVGGNTSSDVHMKDLNTGETKVIADTLNFEGNAKIYDKNIVWHEQDPDGNINSILLHQLITGETGETKVIAQGESGFGGGTEIDNRSPDIYGNYIVWRRGIQEYFPPYDNYLEVVLYDITNGTESIISHEAGDSTYIWVYDDSVAIAGDWVIWVGLSKINPEYSRIYAYKISTQQGPYVINESNLPIRQFHPAIYGKWAIWVEDTDLSNGSYEKLVAYDSDTHQKYIIQEGNVTEPAIYRDIVVWRNWDITSGTKIYMHRLSDILGLNYKLVGNPPQQIQPSICANKIVFAGNIPFVNNPSVYLFELLN
ncbi:MAG: hypothetical protein KKG99_06355 [Bacteroidetes bacterium]|nr:hypothetical protein [Bacteroidota bacterium]